jgi:hypothetical protein
MAEREPDQPPVLHFKLNDEVIDITPENAIGFIHQDEADRQYDHVFVFNPDDLEKEEIEEGSFFWRSELPEFDSVVERMRELGFTIVSHETVQDGDKAVYDSEFPAEITPIELTSSQEDRVAYLAHLLTTDRLTPDDFLSPGELNL